MSTVMTPVTHPIRLTERINRIEPSATMAVVAEADKLRQQGIDVVDFGAGEPHFLDAAARQGRRDRRDPGQLFEIYARGRHG
jgi:aspartate/methionine/tyrosine aminotransferase